MSETRSLIEIRVAELRQLFNSMDASPFRERDLDPSAEEFIVGWAREAPRSASLALRVDLDRAPPPPGLMDEPAALHDAIHEFFTHRAKASRNRLRQLLRIGRISLLVGLAFLMAAAGLGDLIATAMKGERFGELLRQGLVIIGWVAMWRPVEIFLYGWWPIRTEARLYDRLGAMPVRIEYATTRMGTGTVGVDDAWRSDWPAMPPAPLGPLHAIPVRPPGSSKGKQAGLDAVPDRRPVASALGEAVAPEHKSKTNP
ncbi:MAG: hypothetical protein ABIP94_13840 [Planctomycetota bacterium]